MNGTDPRAEGLYISREFYPPQGPMGAHLIVLQLVHGDQSVSEVALVPSEAEKLLNWLEANPINWSERLTSSLTTELAARNPTDQGVNYGPMVEGIIKKLEANGDAHEVALQKAFKIVDAVALFAYHEIKKLAA